MALFRVGLVLWIVVIASGVREWSVLWIAAGVLILVSILADVANALVMGARRHGAATRGGSAGR
jgi:uncharacterized protein YqgC (DUF456 family)